MTDVPDSATDQVADTSTLDGAAPAGDPELAALVRASLERRPTTRGRCRSDPDRRRRDARARGGHVADLRARRRCRAGRAARGRRGDGDTAARPRRRRSLALRFGVAFVLGFLLAVSISGGVLYAWGQQYEGRVLPGVRIGSTDLGGLTPDQAAAAIASAYA